MRDQNLCKPKDAEPPCACIEWRLGCIPLSNRTGDKNVDQTIEEGPTDLVDIVTGPDPVSVFWPEKHNPKMLGMVEAESDKGSCRLEEAFIRVSCRA